MHSTMSSTPIPRTALIILCGNHRHTATRFIQRSQLQHTHILVSPVCRVPIRRFQHRLLYFGFISTPLEMSYRGCYTCGSLGHPAHTCCFSALILVASLLLDRTADIHLYVLQNRTVKYHGSTARTCC